MCSKLLSVLLILWAVIDATSTSEETILTDEAVMKELMTSGFNFARNFSHFVIKNQNKENVVCSPVGAGYTILPSIIIGSRDKNLKRQLRKALSLKTKIYQVKWTYLLWNYEVQSTKNVTLKLASKVYVPEKFKIKEKFRKDAKFYFSTEVAPMKSNLSEFVAKTNEWIREKTVKKIDRIFNEGDITQSTSLVVLNAIYFRGDWKYPFNPKSTRRQFFHQFGNRKVKVHMMYIPRIFVKNGIIEALNAQYVELPYRNSDYKLVIVVPLGKKTNKVKFEALGRNLQNLDYGTLNVTQSMVKLKIPKFTIKSTIDLVPVLKKMGATRMFDNRQANFKSIGESSSDNLHVDKVIQKIFLQVDESCNEYVKDKKPLDNIFSFKSITINKPFYFSILSSQRVLFEGRVIRPKYEGADCVWPTYDDATLRKDLFGISI